MHWILLASASFGLAFDIANASTPTYMLRCTLVGLLMMGLLWAITPAF